MKYQQTGSATTIEMPQPSGVRSYGVRIAESGIEQIRIGFLIAGVDSLRKLKASDIDAIPVLLSAITDTQNGNLRSHICSTLGRMGVLDSAVLEALRDRLSDPESYVRQSAATAIWKIGDVDRKTAGALIAALAIEQEKVGDKHTNEYDRGYMLRALAHGIDSHPNALPIIQSFSDDPAHSVLEIVRDILEVNGIQTNGFEQKIAAAKLVANKAAKKRIAEHDARIYVERVRAGRVAEARDDTWRFRTDHGDAVSILLEASQDNEGNTRSAIAGLLGEMKQDAISAIPALRVLLADSESYVRQAAAAAIWKIGHVDHKTATALITALAIEQGKIGDQYTNEYDREYMLKALAHGVDTHPDALSTIQSFEGDPAQNVRDTVRTLVLDLV